MVKKFQNILAQLPYSKPFLFVDELLYVDENGVKGCYTFDKDLEEYKKLKEQFNTKMKEEV